MFYVLKAGKSSVNVSAQACCTGIMSRYY